MKEDMGAVLELSCKSQHLFTTAYVHVHTQTQFAVYSVNSRHGMTPLVRDSQVSLHWLFHVKEALLLSTQAQHLIPYTATTGLGELLQISQPEYTCFLSKAWPVGIPMHWIMKKFIHIWDLPFYLMWVRSQNICWSILSRKIRTWLMQISTIVLPALSNL